MRNPIVVPQVSKSAIKFIDGYYLRYREISSGQTPPSAFSILTVVAQKTDAYSHLLPNLKKFIQYEVFVSPFFRSVEGQPSNSRTVITSEDSKLFSRKRSFPLRPLLSFRCSSQCHFYC
jgi:hypothetical protein